MLYTVIEQSFGNITKAFSRKKFDSGVIFHAPQKVIKQREIKCFFPRNPYRGAGLKTVQTVLIVKVLPLLNTLQVNIGIRWIKLLRFATLNFVKVTFCCQIGKNEA